MEITLTWWHLGIALFMFIEVGLVLSWFASMIAPYGDDGDTKHALFCMVGWVFLFVVYLAVWGWVV